MRAVTIPEALKLLGYVSVPIPKLNPNHILAVYSKSKEYAQRIQLGPFFGSRQGREDE